MAMTEANAKTKWCPLTRLIATTEGSTAIPQIGGTAGFNRYSGDAKSVPAATCCIGSACMAWRWANGSEPSTLEHMRAGGHAPGQPEGFCGLAGRPE